MKRMIDAELLYEKAVELEAAAAYHTIDDTLRSMYEHELILTYYMNMGFTEDIQ